MSTAIDRPADDAQLTAVLGPTNTGKTHLAIERMLGHRTGMIGFPLRLLARENYDRIVKLKGASSVALITGEERILPPAPRWFVCTVEAMPLDREVAFLAVDEIQVAADRERGHIFTDRLLHARGYAETMFLGADTARPLDPPAGAQGRVRRAAALFEAHLSRAARRSRGCRGAPPSSRSPPPMSTASPSWCAASAAAPPWCSARSARARATPRWRCTRPARSTTWSRPTRSAWASTWTSTTWPSPSS